MNETARPDLAFHPSPRLAMQAPKEHYAYVALLRPDKAKPGAIAVVDTTHGSAGYSRVAHTAELTTPGDELHHFGWNACSSMPCPLTPNRVRGDSNQLAGDMNKGSARGDKRVGAAKFR